MKPNPSLLNLPQHVTFFRLLRTHPSFAHLNFSQRQKIGIFEYQFCSRRSKLIIELSTEPCKKQRYDNARNAGYDMLSYETLIWEEFPEIVIEDMLVFLLAKEKLANPV